MRIMAMFVDVVSMVVAKIIRLVVRLVGVVKSNTTSSKPEEIVQKTIRLKLNRLHYAILGC